MAWTPERPVARLEHRTAPRALQNLRIGEGVAGLDAEAGHERHVGAELGAAGAGQPDVEILRPVGAEAHRPRSNDVAIAVVEPDDVEPHAIPRESLFDRRLDPPRPLSPEARLPHHTCIRPECL